MPMLSGVGFPHALRTLCGPLYVLYWISNQPPYPISTGAMLAPPTREQWYLFASPFLSEAAGTKPPPPICWRNRRLCLDGKWPIILLRGPLGAWGSVTCSKFTTRVKQLKVPPGGLVPWMFPSLKIRRPTPGLNLRHSSHEVFEF
jgi:hypothetical protein